MRTPNKIFELNSMAMHIHLTPEQEEIIRGEIETGHCRTAEEVVAKALQALLDKKQSAATAPSGRQQREAVLEMLDFVEKNHVRLEGVSVRTLIHEGHRL